MLKEAVKHIFWGKWCCKFALEDGYLTKYHSIVLIVFEEIWGTVVHAELANQWHFINTDFFLWPRPRGWFTKGIIGCSLCKDIFTLQWNFHFARKCSLSVLKFCWIQSFNHGKQKYCFFLFTLRIIGFSLQSEFSLHSVS